MLCRWPLSLLVLLVGSAVERIDAVTPPQAQTRPTDSAFVACRESRRLKCGAQDNNSVRLKCVDATTTPLRLVPLGVSKDPAHLPVVAKSIAGPRGMAPKREYDFGAPLSFGDDRVFVSLRCLRTNPTFSFSSLWWSSEDIGHVSRPEWAAGVDTARSFSAQKLCAAHGRSIIGGCCVDMAALRRSLAQSNHADQRNASNKAESGISVSVSAIPALHGSREASTPAALSNAYLSRLQRAIFIGSDIKLRRRRRQDRRGGRRNRQLPDGGVQEENDVQGHRHRRRQMPYHPT